MVVQHLGWWELGRRCCNVWGGGARGLLVVEVLVLLVVAVVLRALHDVGLWAEFLFFCGRWFGVDGWRVAVCVVKVWELGLDPADAVQHMLRSGKCGLCHTVL